MTRDARAGDGHAATPAERELVHDWNALAEDFVKPPQRIEFDPGQSSEVGACDLVGPGRLLRVVHA